MFVRGQPDQHTIWREICLQTTQDAKITAGISVGKVPAPEGAARAALMPVQTEVQARVIHRIEQDKETAAIQAAVQEEDHLQALMADIQVQETGEPEPVHQAGVLQPLPDIHLLRPAAHHPNPLQHHPDLPVHHPKPLPHLLNLPVVQAIFSMIP